MSEASGGNAVQTGGNAGIMSSDTTLDTASPVDWRVPFPDLAQPAAGYPALPGVETQLLCRTTLDAGRYQHHPCIVHHDGCFYAAWSNHCDGEDGPGQRVLGAWSRDGRAWSEPVELLAPMDERKDVGERGRVLTPVAWVPVDGRLHLVAEVNDIAAFRDLHDTRRGPAHDGEIRYPVRDGLGRVACRITVAAAAGGGVERGAPFWLRPDAPAPLPGFPAFPGAGDPAVADAARVIDERLAHPLHAPAWEFRYRSASMPAADGHPQCEPTAYRRRDGALVRLTRDSRQSHRVYAALSHDEGASWTAPLATAIPDSPSKSRALNLPDGRVLVIGNFVSEPFDRAGPGHLGRDPLVLACSDDGVVFDRAWAVLADAPEIRLRGPGKGRGFQYPDAVLAGDALWVIHSIGKEDIGLARVPLAALD